MKEKWKLREAFSDWKAKVSIRRDKKALILTGISAAVYIALFAAAFYYEGFKPVPALILAGLFLAGMALCLVRMPFFAILRIAAALAIPAAELFLIEMYTHDVSTLVASAIRLNLILYYLITAILFFAGGNLGAACSIWTVFLMICGIANYFVFEFRSSPIVPWDFYSIGTAMSVADNYTFSIPWEFAWITGAFLTLFLLARHVHIRFPGGHKNITIPIRLILTAASAAVMVNLLLYLWDPDTINKEGLNKSIFVSANMYKKDGFVLAFTINLRYMNLEEPDGYSAEEAAAVLEEQEIKEEDPEVLPDIIVVMSETFSDLSVLGDLPTNQDYMPFIHSLLDGAENVISGDLYVSVLGGNTADSEFEFLTGNTMKFFPTGSVPYQQYIHSDVLTIVDELHELGYTAAAMHPYRRTGWNRCNVYPLMHFDEMSFITDLTYRTKLRNYVSDASDYRNVLKRLDEQDEEEGPLFMLNVTMQNHSAYGGSYDNFDPQIQAEFRHTSSNKYLNNYLSLIYETDQATEDFLTELSEREDPVIVVFFGDHQPNDYVVKPIYKENGMDIDNQTIEEQQNRQITPFFIWANFDIPEASDVKISANYLSLLLFQTLGFELNEYQTFLESVEETFPIMNAVGYFDADGNCKEYSEMTEEEQSVYDTYEKVQYYRMFDEEE